MLSLHTNFASLAAQNSLSRTQSALSTSQTRLSTGFRINSAMDDAAGMQIATRLRSQTSGMAVAMRNTQNATSMLQTAEGAVSEVSSMLTRMKDLATQSADASSSIDDRTAMQSEYDALGNQLSQIMSNTTFGGMNLLKGTSGALTSDSTFQIGATTADTFVLKLAGATGTASSATGALQIGTGFLGLQQALVDVSSNYSAAGTAVTTTGTELTSAATTGDVRIGANGHIAALDNAIASVNSVRSSLGAAGNRLDHVYNNLTNISTNVRQATSRIVDVDYATETANMTTQQMLAQAGTSMLKQSGQMSQMVMSLLQ